MEGVTWDPDLRLSLGRSADAQSPPAGADFSCRGNGAVEEPFTATSTSTRHLPLQQQQQITIFYSGQICVCDVTEIQARSIISMAKGETDAMVEKSRHQEQRRQIQSSSSPLHGAAAPSSSSPVALHEQLLNPSALSMKRSLQRFLEKRKARADDVSPYSCHKRPFFFPIKS